MPPKLSKITDNLLGQPMFKLLAKAREMENLGQEIIHFEIGDPNFDSPDIAKNTLKDFIDKNYTHYTNSMGIIEFRKAVQSYTQQYWGFRPLINQILECPANAIIDFVIRCVADPNDEIIYPDPGFPTYYSAIKYNGMIPIGIQLKEKNNFCMKPEDIQNKITSKTKLIIINSPSNPTGAVMSQNEVEKIAIIAKENNIYLLSDEVYSQIVYDKIYSSPAGLDKCKEHTIILNSLSKMFSMSGWRLGYAVGPKELIEKMGLLLQTIISCQPNFTQQGGAAILNNHKGCIENIVSTLRGRRSILIAGINDICGLNCTIPDGAFYVFINIKNTNMISNEYAEKLLLGTGVCVLPGNCFGEHGEGYVRLCYASASIDLIKKALNKMKEFSHTYD